MRKLLNWTAILTVTFAILLLGVHIVGGLARSKLIAMLDPGNCESPCWHGIRPGVTTFEEAVQLFHADQSFDTDLMLDLDTKHCWTTINPPGWAVCATTSKYDPQGPIQRLWLTHASPNPHLGDVMVLFGQPIGSRAVRDGNGFYGDGSLDVTLMFGGNVTATIRTWKLPLNPNMEIQRLDLFEIQPYLRLEPWRGFAKRLRLPPPPYDQ